jgi:hypothetical protein
MQNRREKVLNKRILSILKPTIQKGILFSNNSSVELIKFERRHYIVNMNKLLLLLVIVTGSCIQNSTSKNINSTNSGNTTKKINCDTLLHELEKMKSDTFGGVTRIPNNFEESLSQLDTLINDGLKEWIKCLPDG